jgi:hypothetical protein
VTKLLARKSEVQIPAEARVLFYSTSGLIMGSTQHPRQWVPWCSFPGGKKAGTMRLNTYLHLVLRLRMNGVVLSLPLYAFITCTGTTSHPSYLSTPFSFTYSVLSPAGFRLLWTSYL